MRHTDAFEALIETLKVSVARLRRANIPFMLGGSLAAWARGGPEPKNDLDLIVKPQDAEAALAALEAEGMHTERPPEEWLYKAWNDGVLIDIIFEPSGLDITDEVLARAETIPVMAVSTPVMALEDMLTTMLYALDEHCLDYGALIAIARSLREQIDWTALRNRATRTAYARAFFTLVEELGIAPPQPSAQRASHSRVRVLPGG